MAWRRQRGRFRAAQGERLPARYFAGRESFDVLISARSFRAVGSLRPRQRSAVRSSPPYLPGLPRDIARAGLGGKPPQTVPL